MLWDNEGNELSPRDQFLFVDPLHLPWEAKALSNHLYDDLLECVNESDETCRLIGDLNTKLRSVILTNTLQLHAAYGFAIEWDMKKFLKAFGYHAVAPDESSLLDNAIEFLSYVSDMKYQGSLVFVNARSFFSETDYRYLVDQLVFLGIQAIFLENRSDWEILPKERKFVVDEDLLELHIERKSEFPSSSRGEFAPMVLEQWNSDW